MNDDERRVYADSLLDKGETLGELIHIQLDLETDRFHRADRIARRRRERELFREHAARWVAPLGDVVQRGRMPTFRRGFIDELTIDADVFATRDLFAHAPQLRGVVLTGINEEAPSGQILDRFRAALESPNLDRLHGLMCRVGQQEDVGGYEPRMEFRSLARHATPIFVDAVPRMRSLRALAMFDPEDRIDDVVRSGIFAQLERLDLSTFTADTAQRALDATSDRLRELVLPSVWPEATAELLAHPRISQLRALAVPQLGGGGPLVAEVMQRAAFPKLRRLGITYGTEEVIEVIASSPAFSDLVELDLGSEGIIDFGPLAKASRLHSLRVFRVPHRFMAESVLRQLIEMPIVGNLELLDLRLCHAAHVYREALRMNFDGVLLASETWGGWFETALYDANMRVHYTSNDA